MMRDAFLSFAIETARAAGQILRDGQHKAKSLVSKSSSVDIVTEFDQAVEKLILNRIQRAYPSHAIVAEESGETRIISRYTWYVDPIDGTTNFAHGFPVFCVSIALYLDGKPYVGVVYDPTRDECFGAAAERGAYVYSADNTRTRLHVSQTKTLLSSLIGTGFPYDRHTSEHNNYKQFGAFLTKTQGMRRAGAAALDLAYVAAGRLDGYWEYKLKSWDCAAGILLVREAGGTVTTTDGNAPSISPTMALIASNGHIHTQMQNTLDAA